MDSLQKTVKEEKQDLRSRMKRKRKELSSRYCREADRQILFRLQSTEVYKRSRYLFCYVSLEEKVDTKRLIEEALREGKCVSVPRCGKNGQMEAYEINTLQDLEEGFHGISEPKAHCMRLDPGRLELCIIPCLACSEKGFRLGYGGGYYDRYLPKTEAFRALICREMLMCQDIPAESHDCSGDMIITEKRIIFC